jgi:hypothetical protein
MTVDFNDGGINHSIFHVRFLRNRVKNSLENISFAPVIEPAVGRAPVAKRGWQVTPGTTRPHNPQHSLKE